MKAKNYYPSFSTIQKIVEVFPDFALMKNFDIKEGIANLSEGAPYYNVSFTTGWDDLKNYYCYNIIYPPHELREHAFWINQLGDAMYPLIQSGDKIELEKKDAPEIGRIFAIATAKGVRVISWVTRSPLEKQIRLIPENRDPKYGEYLDVSLNEIVEAYEVIGVLRTF